MCGTAAKEGKTQLVEDVERFPGHIACDGASKSEIVVPVVKGGKVSFCRGFFLVCVEREEEEKKDGLGLARAISKCWLHRGEWMDFVVMAVGEESVC